MIRTFPQSALYVQVSNQSNIPMLCVKKLIPLHTGLQIDQFFFGGTLTKYIFGFESQIKGTPQIGVYPEKFNIDFLAQIYPGFYMCTGTPPKSLGEKPNVKFFTVNPYFWAVSFVGLSKSAENDTYC